MSNEGQNKEGIIQGSTNPDRQLPGLDFASFSSMSVTNSNAVSSDSIGSQSSFNKDIVNASIDNSSSNQLNKTENLNDNLVKNSLGDSKSLTPNQDKSNNLSSSKTDLLNQSTLDLNLDNSQSLTDKSTNSSFDDFSKFLSSNNFSNGLAKQDQVVNQPLKQDQVVDPNSNLQIDNSANQQLSQQSFQQIDSEAKQDQVVNQPLKQDQVVDPNSNLQIDNSANQQLSQQISQQNNDQPLVLSKDSNNSDQDPFSSGVPSVDELFGTNSQIKELESQIKSGGNDNLSENNQVIKQKDDLQAIEKNFNATSSDTQNNSSLEDLNSLANDKEILLPDSQLLSSQTVLDKTVISSDKNAPQDKEINQNQVDDSQKIIADSQTSSNLQSNEVLPTDHQIQIISNSSSQEQEIKQEHTESIDLKSGQNKDLQDLNQDNSKITDNSISQVQSSIPVPASNILQNQVQENKQNNDSSKNVTNILSVSAYSQSPTNREKIISVILGQNLDQNALSKFIFPDSKNDKILNELGVGEIGVSTSDLKQIKINTNDSEVVIDQSFSSESVKSEEKSQFKDGSISDVKGNLLMDSNEKTKLAENLSEKVAVESVVDVKSSSLSSVDDKPKGFLRRLMSRKVDKDKSKSVV